MRWPFKFIWWTKRDTEALAEIACLREEILSLTNERRRLLDTILFYVMCDVNKDLTPEIARKREADIAAFKQSFGSWT